MFQDLEPRHQQINHSTPNLTYIQPRNTTTPNPINPAQPYPTYLTPRSENIRVPYNSSEATNSHPAKSGNNNANVQTSDNLNSAAAIVVDLEPNTVSANSSGSILFFNELFSIRILLWLQCTLQS